MNEQRPGRYILPIIVISQFAGTSLWFAGNAILPDLKILWDLPDHSIGWVSSSVQAGFITGTFLFALIALTDRYRAHHVYFVCSVLGALANALIVWFPGLIPLLVLRFLVGFFLAGIYPVGMKLAASWFQSGLGKAMGLLVGALVFGKAAPHLIRSLLSSTDWQLALFIISGGALVGGIAVLLLVPEGPFARRSTGFSWTGVFRIFRNANFRSSALGYFGHMWELYAFWTFLPTYVITYNVLNNDAFDVSFTSFLIMSMGGIGCIIGGFVSQRFGSARVAAVALLISGICCLLSPIFLAFDPMVFLVLMFIWGCSVVADSPQFSTLNAISVDADKIGTGLTIATSLGFLVSVFSIELLNVLSTTFDARFIYVLLVPGPVLGLLAIRRLLNQASASASS